MGAVERVLRDGSAAAERDPERCLYSVLEGVRVKFKAIYCPYGMVKPIYYPTMVNTN